MQNSSTLHGMPPEADQANDPLARADAIRFSATDLAFSAVVFVLDLGALGLALAGRISVNWALLLHFAVVCIPVAFFVQRQKNGGDLTIPTLLALATLVGGPMGTAAVLSTAVLLWRRNPQPLRLREWYDYIMGVVERGEGARLYDELSAGRTPVDHLASVPHFTPILEGASIEDQQRALSVIGRRFHSDFRPILRLALRNKDGLIRAQAAAIASRLDLKEKALLWAQDGEGEQGAHSGDDQQPHATKDAG